MRKRSLWSFTIQERSFLRSSCKMLAFALWKLSEVTIYLKGRALEIVVRSSPFRVSVANDWSVQESWQRDSCCRRLWRSKLFFPQASREAEAETDENLLGGEAGVRCVYCYGVTGNCTTWLRRW